MLSNIVSDVETMRLDSEYHLKAFIRIDVFKKANQHRFCKFSDYGLTIDCSAFYPGIEQFYGQGNNPLIRVQNVKSGVIDYDSCATLPNLPSEYDTLKWVNEGDIIITKGGSIGFAGYVTKNALASRDLIFIKSSEKEASFSKYLYLFFSTGFAYKQLIRSSSQCAQPHLTITLVKDFDILKVTDAFMARVARLYDKSMAALAQSRKEYDIAENLLLEELGLTDWHPSNSSFNIKSLKASFLSSGRLDAEHYQVKFDELEAIIESVPHKTIAELQSFNARGVQPDYVDGGGVSVINSKHILEDGLDYDNFEHTTADFLSSHERARIGYGDILIYTTGANIGRTQVYLRDGQAIASNHVNILRVKGVNPIYLALVLNSPVGRMQTEKLCTGSAQAEIYPSDIEKFVAPILDETTQESIAAKVQECFAMKTESKRLLNAAKEAVEIAISDSEEKALQYIKNKRMTNTGEKL